MLRLPMFAALFAISLIPQVASAGPPEIGDMAPTLRLPEITGDIVELQTTFAKGKTVLVVLRGYPGYQCGICSRQAAGYLNAATDFDAAGLQVVMIYPGPASDLGAHAEEFLRGKKLPKSFLMLLDPDYQFTNTYGLRWDAPRETAYPATFIVEQGGEVAYAKVSNGHGGRVSAKAALEAARK